MKTRLRLPSPTSRTSHSSGLPPRRAATSPNRARYAGQGAVIEGMVAGGRFEFIRGQRHGGFLLLDLFLWLEAECSASFKTWQPQPGPYQIAGWQSRRFAL